MATRLFTFGVVGALVLSSLVAALLLLLRPRDRRLRSRDEIASALGCDVIASLRGRHPSNVSAWTTLMLTYEPGTVDSWALRQALRQLAPDIKVERTSGSLNYPDSLTVVSLEGDGSGLAVGPQLASFASSSGVNTRIVGAQRQESAAALWAACSLAPGDRLRDSLIVDTRPSESRTCDLLVVLVVVSRSHPSLQGLPNTEALVLALSSGAASAEELALVAMAADDAGRHFDGVIVPDPDRLDHTTGRIVAPEPKARTDAKRLTGRALEGRAAVSDFRRRLR
jgi:hypothetical protein